MRVTAICCTVAATWLLFATAIDVKRIEGELAAAGVESFGSTLYHLLGIDPGRTMMTTEDCPRKIHRSPIGFRVMLPADE